MHLEGWWQPWWKKGRQDTNSILLDLIWCGVSLAQIFGQLHDAIVSAFKMVHG